MTTKTAKMAHTPGPWSVQDAGRNSGNVIRFEVADGIGNHICEIEDGELERGPVAAREDEGNARLIAAAPELLACLKELADGHSMAAEARARAAISKATGEIR